MVYIRYLKIFSFVQVKQFTKYALLCFVFSLILWKSEQALAQHLPDSILVFKGEVLTADSLKPIEDVHIISKFNHWGTISNEEGKFNMYVSKNDSLLITSVGYRPIILHVLDSMISESKPYPILMRVDTIRINEVVIRAFWDYQTFKLIISQMEPLDFDYERVNFKENLMLSTPVNGTGLHPIQALYNVLNRDARLQRKLIKIRKEYNTLMMQLGRPEDTIPSRPEHMLR